MESRLLPGVGAINTGVNQTTGISSVEMRTGMKPITNLALSPELLARCRPDVAERMAQQQLIWSQATTAMADARRVVNERMAATRLKPHWLSQLRVGDRVLVESKNLTTPAFKAGLINRKTEDRYYGPYKVVAFTGRRTVEIELPPQSRAWPHFHVSRLKPFRRGMAFSGE